MDACRIDEKGETFFAFRVDLILLGGVEMIKVAVCNDNRSDLETLVSFVREYSEGFADNEIEVSAFLSANALEERLASETFDIYILKVVMPGKGGLELARRIRETGQADEIIFTTAFKEFAYEAYSLYVDRYLLKPISKPELMEALDFGIRKLERGGERSFPIKTRGNVVKVLFDSIEYVENSSRIMRFHLRDGQMVESVSMREPFEQRVSALLKAEKFVHPHKSYVVNLDYVVRMTSGELELECGMVIPISRANTVETKKAYLQHITNKS